MKLFRFSILFFAMFALLVSCSSKANNSKQFIIKTVLTASGPLFEGSNTFQAEIRPDLADFIKKNEITIEQIVDITLVSATATPNSQDNLNIFQSISLQISSDNFPMQNVAFANNMKENLKKVELKVADLQEKLKSILLEEKSYVIADGTIKEDYDNDLNLGIELVFSINYNK